MPDAHYALTLEFQGSIKRLAEHRAGIAGDHDPYHNSENVTDRDEAKLDVAMAALRLIAEYPGDANEVTSAALTALNG